MEVKCAVLVCNNKPEINYNQADFCGACYVTIKYLEKSEYQLGDR